MARGMIGNQQPVDWKSEFAATGGKGNQLGCLAVYLLANFDDFKLEFSVSFSAFLFAASLPSWFFSFRDAFASSVLAALLFWICVCICASDAKCHSRYSDRPLSAQTS